MHNQFSMSFKSRSWNLQQYYCDNLQNIGGMQVFHTTDLHVSLWNADHAAALSSLFLFVCFFLCQNFSAIISNKIKFFTCISLIGKSRLGFLPNGNPPLHGFQYNSSKLYRICFQSLCWLRNLGKKSWFCNCCKTDFLCTLDHRTMHVSSLHINMLTVKLGRQHFIIQIPISKINIPLRVITMSFQKQSFKLWGFVSPQYM